MATELRISIIYFVVSALWIWFSDTLLLFLPRGETLQTYKGWIFVFLTTMLLFYLLHRELEIRRRNKRHLQQSEARFRQLFVENPLPTFIYDPAKKVFLNVNDAALRRYGYSREEFLSIPMHRLYPENEVQPEKLLLSFHEMQHVRKNGQVMDVEVFSSTLHFEDRESVLAVVLDITERKQLSQELLEKDRMRVAIENERELRTAREKFTAMISHEIRSPLTVISTSVELLQNYHSRMTVEDQHRHFEKINIQIQRISELLSEALSFWRLESIGMDMKPVRTEVNAFVSELVDEMRTAIKGSHHFEFSRNGVDLPVNADPKLLRYAVSNLLQNAVKYSPKGMSVFVSVEHDENTAIIRVRDQGIGIPEPEQTRIFEPFYRAGNVGTVPGTGLGLGIARQAIELHQGTLDIEAAGQPGTMFVIRLPLVKNEA